MTNSELLTCLKSLVTRERELTTEVLRHLRLVEERKLYLERGYPSLFVFCVDELGYSEPEAHVRIQAMRLMRAIPQVEEKIESGQLTLTVAARAQSCFRREEITLVEQEAILEELEGATTREAERKLATRFPQTLKKESETPVSADLTRISFTATKEQLAKYELLKELLAHKNFEGRYDQLFEELADRALAELNAPILRAPQVTPRHSRNIPKSTRQIVYLRADGRCQYVDAVTQRRCTGRHGVQIDHIVPHAHGGLNDPTNLQLLCGAHNRWKGAG